MTQTSTALLTEFAAEVARDLRADAETAAVEVSVRRARLQPVRGDLPAPVVSHHASGEPVARASRPGGRRSRGVRCRAIAHARDDRRVGMRQRREADGPRRSASGSRRECARPLDRHFVAGARADGTTAHAPQTLFRRRSPVDLRRRAAQSGCRARSRQSRARVAPGFQHRQLRYAGCRCVHPAHPRGARAGRLAAARRRPRETRRSAASCLRRSARRHRRVQQEPAGSHQSRAAGQFRSR